MKKALLTVAIISVAALAARADVELAWDVSTHGSPADTTLQASTINPNLTDTGVGDGLNELMRTGVNPNATANSFASTNWNTTNTFNESDKYVGVTLTPNTSVTLTSLDYAINGSSTAPGTGLWGFSTQG